jgi:hypothetical protein
MKSFLRAQSVFYICFISLILSCNERPVVSIPSDTFKAYYTKVISGEEFEKYSRTGPYADIIVELGEGNGRLVFWRGSSYLPYWETSEGKWFVDELVPRSGDGRDMMPDRTNAASHVRLISANDDSVLVHWRYEPDFSLSDFFDVHPGDEDNRENDIEFVGLNPMELVDEYFTIKPDGMVARTVKMGTDKYKDWIDPLNKISQTFKLSEDGIVDYNTSTPKSSDKEGKGDIYPVIESTVLDPQFWIHFDENHGDEVVESISKNRYQVKGHHTIWKKGVSGSAIQFDGYSSQIEMPSIELKITSAITVEAWIAIGATPWNWTPIIQQGNEGGYFLGMNDKGQIGFKLQNNELTSKEVLESGKWYHIAGTYNPSDGFMRLFINGEGVADVQIDELDMNLSGKSITIGKGKPMEATNVVRFESDFPSDFGFEGLIDEVRIFNRALSVQEVAHSYRDFGRERMEVDLEKRAMPDFVTKGKFDARYTKLNYHEAWDNMWRVGDYADIVVEFEKSPSRLIFWRGCSYIPEYITENGFWFNNEFNEIWATETEQCMEPIGDIKGFFTHVRILEKTEARIVIHWRFALNDTRQGIGNFNEETGWGEFADWYYYIYPDGIVALKNVLWTDMSEYRGSEEGMREWQESMVIVPPGMHPEQIYVTDSLFYISDLDRNNHISAWGPEVAPEAVIKINLQSEYDPFIIGNIISGGTYYGELTEYSVFPFWNHWPVALMTNDGRNGKDNTRMGHSSVLQLTLENDSTNINAEAPWVMQSRLEGMTNKSLDELVSLANSYLRAPQINECKGCSAFEFDKSQKAYVLDANKKTIQFSIPASEQSPLYNPCFVVNDWKSSDLAKVKMDGDTMESDIIKQGIVLDTRGKEKLIIWIEKQITEEAEFTITY